MQGAYEKVASSLTSADHHKEIIGKILFLRGAWLLLDSRPMPSIQLGKLQYQKTKRIIGLYNKVGCYDSFSERDMLRWRRAKFEDNCVAVCPRKLESTAPDVDLFFKNELARQAFKCFKKRENSGDSDAGVLDIICLEAEIRATVEIL